MRIRSKLTALLLFGFGSSLVDGPWADRSLAERYRHQQRFGWLVDSVGDVADCEGAGLEPLPSLLDPQQAQWSGDLVQLQRDLLLRDVAAVVRAPDTVEESA